MPLTTLQAAILALLAPQRSEQSYFAGGAALHMGPGGERYSNDLDFFHAATDAANQSFVADATTLRAAGYTVEAIAEHRGFVSAIVRRAGESTMLEWAHESAWRFLPLVEVEGGGLVLHPIDLAINKLVALANRREPRDLVDAIFADTHILPFPALVWAVVEKNPGLNPAMYLEQFRRRTLTPEDAAYLRFTGAYRVEDAARHFRRMVAETDAFIAANTSREPGALLQDRRTGAFFAPQSDNDWAHTREHRGALGGVVAQPADMPFG
ncbi:MAG: hypothetical protein IPP90_06440 [Gemmatimonadaceae bacterium]|nr:hypothetical protein [Gemmatimonadaceae bacterium]